MTILVARDVRRSGDPEVAIRFSLPFASAAGTAVALIAPP